MYYSAKETEFINMNVNIALNTIIYSPVRLYFGKWIKPLCLGNTHFQFISSTNIWSIKQILKQASDITKCNI